MKIGIIIPVFNEAEGLKDFHSSLIRVLEEERSLNWLLFYIDDGSHDNSYSVIVNLKNKKNIRVEPISFSRNFGKEAAVTAGIHKANEENLDAAIIIDSDGQHPVTLIPEFVKLWQKGVDMVVGIRKNDSHESFIKKFGSKIFYKTMSSMGDIEVVPRSTDYRLISNEVISEFTKLTEHSRITRGLIDWLGYKKGYIEFEALERTYGVASYSVKKLFKLAINSYLSLSMVPLYISGYVGIFFIISALIVGIFIGTEQYILQDPLNLNISGSAILGIIILFLVGLVLSSIGLLALYISKILEEVKNRPLYIIRTNQHTNIQQSQTRN
jgi:dolichol-phosphate mannosyltransferase